MEGWIDINRVVYREGYVILAARGNNYRSISGSPTSIMAAKDSGYTKAFYVPKPETLMPTVEEAIALGLVEDDGSISDLGVM